MNPSAETATFMATHARLLDRRRFQAHFAGGDPARTLTALAGYANPDGGFGHGLEPDQRAPSSQPAGALHALELLEEAGIPGHPLAAPLGDWLTAAVLPGGGLPFATAGAAGPGVAPWWAGADPQEPSLHASAAIAHAGQRLAAIDEDVAAGAWLGQVTAFCREQIAALREPGPAYELRYALWLLDALGDRSELERLVAWLPPDGRLPVAGGVEGEALRPLDVNPQPEGPLADLLGADFAASDLIALAAECAPDGGWTVDFPPSSPAAALEWRGHATVKALLLLRAHGR